MQLKTNIKKDILNHYKKWLDAYLNADVETYNPYFDEVFHFIGSTDNEEFLSREHTTQFFKETADQLAGKCDLRNETYTLEQFGKQIFITHIFDAWFLNNGDSTYYGKFRFSSIMPQTADGWRIIYQHFSTPDSKSDLGDTIGFEKSNDRRTNMDQKFAQIKSFIKEKQSHTISLSVFENGHNILKKLSQKMYQPFVKFKSTAKVIALDLSMSYNIIRKTYQRELIFQRKLGEGTRLIIKLP